MSEKRESALDHLAKSDPRNSEMRARINKRNEKLERLGIIQEGGASVTDPFDSRHRQKFYQSLHVKKQSA